MCHIIFKSHVNEFCQDPCLSLNNDFDLWAKVHSVWFCTFSCYCDYQCQVIFNFFIGVRNGKDTKKGELKDGRKISKQCPLTSCTAKENLNINVLWLTQISLSFRSPIGNNFHKLFRGSAHWHIPWWLINFSTPEINQYILLIISD